jgi:predicted TIM-barrel fold metal-dependent hydrolase
MIIDFHTHIFPPQVEQNRRHYLGDACFAALYANEKTKLATAHELIEAMEDDGVDVSVVLNIGWTNHDFCIETNDYIMQSVARYPEQLVGFGSIPPKDIAAALKEIERCAAGGLKGIGEIRPDMQSLDLSDKEAMQPLTAALIEHNLILLTHTSEPLGHRYPGKGEVVPQKLYSFILDNPELNIICAHWGGGLPFYALMPEVKQALAKVYFDTAVSPMLYSPQIYRQVSQLVGVEKILFGTDYPLMVQSRVIEDIESAELAEDEKKQILGLNAKRLLGID